MIVTTISGCGIRNNSQNEEKSSIKIGVSIYDEYEPYLAKMSDGLNYWAKYLEQATGKKIYIDIVYASGSQITQNDQVEEFANKNYDVLCVTLVDRTDASVIIEKAKSADIPVIFFNRELVEEDLERWEKLYYVGGKASQAGIIQGKIVTDLCRSKFDEIDRNNNGKLEYVMIEGEAGHQDALVRTDVSVKTVSDSGYVLQKIGDEIANWNRAQAKTKMQSILSKVDYEEIEVVFANDDDMALGVIDALEEVCSDKSEYPVIVGVNGMEEALNKVKTGEMAGTVYNNYKEQTRMIIEMAYALGLGQELPEDIELEDGKYVYVPYELITYENVQEYIVNLDKY